MSLRIDSYRPLSSIRSVLSSLGFTRQKQGHYLSATGRIAGSIDNNDVTRLFVKFSPLFGDWESPDAVFADEAKPIEPIVWVPHQLNARSSEHAESRVETYRFLASVLRLDELDYHYEGVITSALFEAPSVDLPRISFVLDRSRLSVSYDFPWGRPSVGVIEAAWLGKTEFEVSCLALDFNLNKMSSLRENESVLVSRLSH
jgi:hypothetical protein